jgi:hypothetical protein
LCVYLPSSADRLIELAVDPLASYALIIRTEPSRSPNEPIEIRFHGLGFSEGRFEISVVGADRWKLAHDYPEDSGSRTSIQTTEHVEGQPSPKTGPAIRPRFSQRFSSHAIKDALELPTDPARFKGAQGACTLSITPVADDSRLVQIKIAKKNRSQFEAVSDIARMGALLTEASRRAALLIEDLEEEEWHGRLGVLQPGERELRRANATLQATKSAMEAKR